MALWKLDQVPWEKFDPSAVDPVLLQLAKGSSLVEFNSGDYVEYLSNVFHDDETIKAAIREWGEEERQHGTVLRQWVRLADPTWDFDRALAKFLSVYRIPVASTSSVRGSRSQELVARCLVETGTSTYYSALGDASKEPVFKQICKYIAADEIHHYKLFFDHLKRYSVTDRLSKFARIKTAIERSIEVEDEELALAFACANYPDRDVKKENFKEYMREFLPLTYELYQKPHIVKAINLLLNAAGLPPKPWLRSSLVRGMTVALKVRRWQTALRRRFGRKAVPPQVSGASQTNDDGRALISTNLSS